MGMVAQTRRPQDLFMRPFRVALAARPCVGAARLVIGLMVVASILASATATAAGRTVLPSTYTIEAAPPGLPPVRLYAEELGSGPPLLLLHGLGGSGYTWRYMVEGLARNHRVIALDLKGFGRSDKPYDQHYAALDQAAYVRSFLEQRGLRGITLVGHSFGGAVAMAVALDFNRGQPDRIGRLVLMDTPAFPQELSPTVQLLRKPVLPMLALSILPPLIVAQLSLINDDGAFAHLTPNDVSMYAAPLADPGAAHALVTTAQRIVPENFAALVRRYPTIRQKTLLLWCRNDTVVPVSSGVQLERMMPHARLELIDGCGHTPPEENPRAATAHILRFLQQR